MTDTIRELVVNFNLKNEVDWGLLGVIADAFREEGEELLADYLQWSAENTVLFNTIDYSVLGPIYGFLWGATTLCERDSLPPALDYLVPASNWHAITRPASVGRFYNNFVWVYLQTVVSFMKLHFSKSLLYVVLPDCCLTLTSKMWPHYDCKGKTLGQIKEELSNV